MSGEKSLPRVGSAVLVHQDNRVLLGVRGTDPNRGRWVIPGGKIRPFESFVEAAKREIREETGLEVEIENQIGVFEIIEPPDEHRLIVYSWARPVGGALKAADDILDLRFVGREEIETLDVTPIVREVLACIRWVAPEQPVHAGAH